MWYWRGTSIQGALGSRSEDGAVRPARHRACRSKWCRKQLEFGVLVSRTMRHFESAAVLCCLGKGKGWLREGHVSEQPSPLAPDTALPTLPFHSERSYSGGELEFHKTSHLEL